LIVQLGTWQSSPEEVEAAVSHALDVGYRHIDTAFGYQNEVDVGRALNKAFASGKLKREDVFVTTKLWATYADRVEEGLELSLKNLGLDYIDLYLVHWPIMMNPKGTTQLPLHAVSKQNLVIVIAKFIPTVTGLR
jgi:glycerol 2-dehydrogenase (NADP+)